MDRSMKIKKKERKEIKARAKHVIKKHYWILLITCLMAAFIGTEFADSLSALSIRYGADSSESGVASVHSQATLDSIQKVLAEVIAGRPEEGEKFSEDTIAEMKQSAGNPAPGRTRGVFSLLVNSITSGAFVVKFYQTVSSLIGSSDAATVILIILSFLVMVFFSFYIQSSYMVVFRRVFLEARTYEKISAQRFLFLLRVRRWTRTAWNLFVLMVFQYLWALTIIGIVIKRYSYFMVPYILAENPDMKAREAIILSRRMMKGHKWECCKLEPDIAEPGRKGIQGFLSRWFGIVLINSRTETAYELAKAQQARRSKWNDVLTGKSYPGRLFPIPESQKREALSTLRYARNYSVPSLIMLFFSFSFIGWLWEVSLHLISDGVFVNRGVLHGPWLPIYGTGGVLILTVLKKLRDKPHWEFLAAMILCGGIEYVTSWYLERMHGGTKWWDYTGYFLNLHGRICAEGLLVFGLGGMAIVYAAAPLLDNLFRRIENKILLPICLALILLFACDEIYSYGHPNTGKGITDYTARAESADRYSGYLL